ncbi:MAG: glycosyl hydrolase family 5 [Gammaproteobacteria bacterium]|nr:glycosyl hydrolase family 5 [Gammaproteobacteria bacterium]
MRCCAPTWAALWLCGAAAASADTVHIDAAPAHVVNRIRPREALGAGVDRLPYGLADQVLRPEVVGRLLEAGWQPVSYRQNTELHIEAWHWNPRGTWSGAGERGYFVGESRPGAEPIVHSWGYPLPRRGVTRDDGTDNEGYSRLTDGDAGSFWKSNPYLTHAFTHEEDALHPQWVIVDLALRQPVDAIRLEWADPYAQDYLVQFWTGEDPIKKPAAGSWQLFPGGRVRGGSGGAALLRLAARPLTVQFVRILMTRSSDTCVDGDRSDARNCLGYALREIGLGTVSAEGAFHDVVRHTKDQDQTMTYCSSVDPWHTAADLAEQAGEQVGFDRFFTSGITRGLPAMLPIALMYSTPEDAVAQLRYLEARGYPVSYVEMGEEPDGHYTTPEDYAELYLQFAAALHRFDPALKLGGPVFTGQNEDVQTWADAAGDTSWVHRFIDYLARRGRLGELAFFSFEHYPFDPGKISWSGLYDEAQLVTHMLKVWREDGVPASVPLFITESNITPQYSEVYLDVWSALWLADYVGAFLAGGGDALYYFHYIPEPLGAGAHGSVGTFNFFAADAEHVLGQPLAQYFASRLINLRWLGPGDGVHGVFRAASDVEDGAGHVLVTAYPVQRPDGSWAVLLVNKDQDNAHRVEVRFEGVKGTSGYAGEVTVSVFGKAQYQWHPAPHGGHAQPDGPEETRHLRVTPRSAFELPAASITVVEGGIRPLR